MDTPHTSGYTELSHHPGRPSPSPHSPPLTLVTLPPSLSIPHSCHSASLTPATLPPVTLPPSLSTTHSCHSASLTHSQPLTPTTLPPSLTHNPSLPPLCLPSLSTTHSRHSASPHSPLTLHHSLPSLCLPSLSTTHSTLQTLHVYMYILCNAHLTRGHPR